MNISFHKYLLYLVTAIIMSLTSCDSDDMDNGAWKADYESVVNQIVASDGTPRFPTPGDNEIVLLGCDSEDVANGFVTALTLGRYTGERSFILDIGNYGSVTIFRYNTGTDRYFRIEVNLKEHAPLRIMLTSVEFIQRFSNENNGGSADTPSEYVYRCPNCGACYTFIPDECPNCKYPCPDNPSIGLIPIPSFTIDEITVSFENEVNQAS